MDVPQIVEYAFEPGKCQCINCRNNGHNSRHTFNFSGKTYSRNFAKSSAKDIDVALWKSWGKVFKDSLPCRRPVTADVIPLLTVHQHEKFVRLLYEVHLPGNLK